MTWKKLLLDHRNFLIIFITPLVLLPLPLLVTDQKGTCGYMLLLMAVYWCTEALPLAVTGLIPVFMCPLFELLTTAEVCENYLKDSTMMFLGGLFVAIAFEKSRLHIRISLTALKLVGTEPKWLMFGFMLPTWFLSMWISNTATTAMMLPMVEAVLVQLKHTHSGKSREAAATYDNNAFTSENGGHLNKKGYSDRMEAGNKDIELKQYYSITPNTEADSEKQTPNGVHEQATSVKIESHSDTLEGATDAVSVTLSDPDEEEETPEFKQLCIAMTLAVAYAANVGGTATLTGTGPNTILKGHADEIWYGHGLGESPVTYASWLIYGFPQAVINFFFVYMWLRLYYLGWRSFRCKSTIDEAQHRAVEEVVEREYSKLGGIRYNEAAVGVLFIGLVLLWFFRSPGFMTGWGDLFKEGYVGDAVPAIFIATLMFCLPFEVPKCNNAQDRGKADALLDWPLVHTKYPWSIIFLMGGGFALAEACEVSGLSQWIGDQMIVFGNLPGWAMIAIISFLVAMLTEVTSNSATCTILMPIMSSMAESLGMNPLYLMMPTAISTSFAFMLPVATPPNAIAFSYGRITVMDMMKAGIMLNILCVFTVTLATETWAYEYFDYGTIPWETGVNGTTTVPDISTITS